MRPDSDIHRICEKPKELLAAAEMDEELPLRRQHSAEISHRPPGFLFAFQPRQVRAHLRGALVADLRSFSRVFLRMSLHFWRKRRIYPCRRGRSRIENRFENHSGRLTWERKFARRHLV